ncbi:hypothetical protein Bhyg_03028 [Pseudolycoriella hygida]|uniref:Uncharacterized protein n=1 Tax=Pseudolycoriella hygida TaxID=35572 RepID=A0A9Q0NCJ4_9DIPT|nr:hypothetical protein Bhyg_03028 [Pseudolycoriella hygida]
MKSSIKSQNTWSGSFLTFSLKRSNGIVGSVSAAAQLKTRHALLNGEFNLYSFQSALNMHNYIKTGVKNKSCTSFQIASASKLKIVYLTTIDLDDFDLYEHNRLPIEMHFAILLQLCKLYDSLAFRLKFGMRGKTNFTAALKNVDKLICYGENEINTIEKDADPDLYKNKKNAEGSGTYGCNSNKLGARLAREYKLFILKVY